MTSQNSTPENEKIERVARLRWIPIESMRVNPLAQRDLNRSRVDHIASTFDVEQIGTPTVSIRGDHAYIIDGRHRIEAMKQIGWADQQVQCWTYEGLTEQEEAERFLKLNDTLSVDAFSKFKVGIEAGREVECDIDRIVRLQHLMIARTHDDNAVSAVGALRRVYGRGGAPALSKSLRIIRDTYGKPGFSATVIDGFGLLCQRYNGDLNEERVIAKLQRLNGGLAGLLGRAEVIRRTTGSPKAHCIAAAVVEVLNAGRGGMKLASWWREAAS